MLSCHGALIRIASRAHAGARSPGHWIGAFAFPPGVTDNLTVGEASAPVGGIKLKLAGR
jgi:hypothetical protein